VIDDEWRDRYILSASLTNPGERAALYRAAARGVFVKVHPGVYQRAEEWKLLDFDGRHLARMQAIALVRPGTVFSHVSAALVWGLPVVGGDLAVPHSVGRASGGGRSMNGLRRHTTDRPFEVTRRGGLAVTDLADTVIQVAAGFAPEVSVPVLDAALQLPGRFADERSGSPGESLSRVGFHRLRLPQPVLQQRFDDADGLIGFTDFWWPDCRVIGEFDGLGKYLRAELTDRRSIAEIVLDEKRRENRLRALDTRVARWEWPTARDLAALRRVLSEAGLRAS